MKGKICLFALCLFAFELNETSSLSIKETQVQDNWLLDYLKCKNQTTGGCVFIYLFTISASIILLCLILFICSTQLILCYFFIVYCLNKCFDCDSSVDDSIFCGDEEDDECCV